VRIVLGLSSDQVSTLVNALELEDGKREAMTEETTLSNEIDLSGSKGAFNLATTIKTHMKCDDDNGGVSGFILGKLPRCGVTSEHLFDCKGLPPGSKVLYLDLGCLCWAVSGVGQITGSKRIDDASVHEIVVKFPFSEASGYALFVDGELDAHGLDANEDNCDAHICFGTEGAMAHEVFVPDMPRLKATRGDIHWNGNCVVQQEHELGTADFSMAPD